MKMMKKGPFTKPAHLEQMSVEYERFFMVSLDMLCISSYDGHFKKVNPAFAQTLGFTAEELCAKSYMDFIHPDDIEPTIKEVEKQLLTKQQILSFENRYRCKDGSYKWLSWKSAPVGEFMYAAARDVTETKQATEDLRQAKEALELANKELESFSYSVAHDLRAPARSIMSFGTIILEDPDSSLSSDAKHNLHRIMNAGKKMDVLIDALLSLSRLMRQDFIRQPVNLSLIAREVADELQAAQPERKVTLVITPNVSVNGDLALLKIVIANLFANAWKYTSKSNRDAVIEFGESEKDGTRIFFVRDNGAGFDMRYVDKLFGVFQRLHSEKEFEGTGVGLATVKRIIHRHGGRVWANSELDQGATFSFTLESLISQLEGKKSSGHETKPKWK